MIIKNSSIAMIVRDRFKFLLFMLNALDCKDRKTRK